MSDPLKVLRDKLKNDPVARAKFLKSAKTMLAENGIDIGDASVLKSLRLDIDPNDAEQFQATQKSWQTSTVVITTVM